MKIPITVSDSSTGTLACQLRCVFTCGSFFREIYAQIFPHCKPHAEKPKAWRISLLMYRKWTRI